MSMGVQSGIPVLLDWARQNSTIDATALEAVLKFVKPPRDLRLLDQVLRNFLHVWPALIALNERDWSTPEGLALEELATMLLAQPTEIQGLLRPRQGRGDPLAQIMTDAPIYCLLSLKLLYSSKNGALPPALARRHQRFLWFQFWVLDAARRLHLHPHRFAGDAPGTAAALAKRNHGLVCGAERSLRRMSRGYKKYFPTLLDYFASAEGNIRHLIEDLDKARELKDRGDDLAGFSNNLYLLLSTAYTGRERRKISTRRGKNLAPGLPPPAAEEPDEVLAAVVDTDVDDAVLTDFLSKKEVQDAVEAGLAPGDIGRTRTIRTSKAPVAIKAGDSLRDAAIRDREALAAIASNNQYLPYDYARLSQLELTVLAEALQALAAGKSAFCPDEVSAQELIGFVSLVLWTGAPLDSLLAATVAPERSDLAQGWAANQVRLIMHSRQWLPPQLLLPGMAPKNQEWIDQRMVHGVVPYLPLPIPGPLEQHLEDLMLVACERSPTPMEMRLFTDSPELLKEQASAFLRFINRTTGVTRLSLGRVSSHLFHSIARYTTDVVDACLITGRMPPGKNSAAYYYAPCISSLEAAYLLLVSTIDYQSKGHDLPDSHFQASTLKNRQGSTRVGSANCPTNTFLKSFVGKLAAEVETRRERLANQPSIATWVSFHNHYTAYCVMMLRYATGLRAVADPFATFDAFDTESGFMVVHEKGSDGSATPRLVWLPEVCVRQFEEYQAHLGELAEALVLLGIEFADGLAAATAGARGELFPRTAKQLRRKSREPSRAHRATHSPPFLFLLSDNAQHWKLPRSRELKPLIGHLYPIRPNSNRHYLRTRLREMDVPGEVVDALLGHAAYGQQPFSQFSTLSPLDFRAAVEGPISTLMADMGWKVISEVLAQ